MKIVRATNNFIRWPFVFQGFILGIVGSLTAFIAQWIIYLSKYDVKTNTLSFITPIPFSMVAIQCFLFLSPSGSVSALSKHDGNQITENITAAACFVITRC